MGKMILESMQTRRGRPYPLGATEEEGGVNFAIFSKHAQKAFLAFFEPGNPKPKKEISLDPKIHKTGQIWHIFVQDIPQNYFYAYRFDGPNEYCHRYHPKTILVDPFAKTLNCSTTWGEKKEPYLGKVFPESTFDWENDVPLHNPCENLMIYEMHVRGMTQDPSSGVRERGTFLGLIEKIPYLKSLGINAVELLPIFEFDETKNSPITNYWGYMTVNYFAPISRYATSDFSGIVEFKQMVKEFHKAGIEVILDIVLNHTAEIKENEIPISFRGIDNDVYYMLDFNGEDLDFTGCGNTFNCNHPIAISFILSVLRYWVVEMHIDGFRFDLASVFSRGIDGEVLEHPPVLDAINHDPVLSYTKLIAEPWDAVGLYQVGSFPAGKRWLEWNGIFRDITRRFLKGDWNQTGAFANVLCGSANLYHGKAPFNSVNFITSHDGFTLNDLVSYNEKHNEENKENNQDGMNFNDSWNCGVEGPTENPEINSLRERQMRNFLLALTIAFGTPMYLMGDEYGHTRKGNNNPYSQDNKLNYFLWDELEKKIPFFHFYQRLLHFRKNTKLFHRKTFLTEKDVTWHGEFPEQPNWNPDSRLVAYTLLDPEKKEDLYIAFNSGEKGINLTLPKPVEGKKWVCIVDTTTAEELQRDVGEKYSLPPRSAILLKAI